MDVDGGRSSERAIAAVMRRALQQARWSPEEEPEKVLATLRRLTDGLTGVINDPGTGHVDEDKVGIVLTSEPLGQLWTFAAAMEKTTNHDYVTQDPRGGPTSRETFVQQAANSFPYLHQRLSELSAALDQAFPSEET